ncbi:shikimate kinase [Arthrobacter sp. C152]
MTGGSSVHTYSNYEPHADEEAHAGAGTRTLMRPVVLIGHTGTGKSTVGRELARLLGWPFLDSDHVITDRHGDIPTLFREHGEGAFRTYEADIIATIIQSTHPPYVLSVGGGAVLRKENRRHLNTLTVVALTADPATVIPRLLQNPGRPLLRGNPAVQWMTLYEERRPIYAAMADITMDTGSGTPASQARQLLAAVKEPKLTRPKP